jgi:membrane protein
MKKILIDTYKGWSEAGAPRLAAALAYYTLFSMVPLLLLVFSIAGLFGSQGDVQAGIMQQVHATLGANASQAMDEILEGSKYPKQGIFASVIGFIMMVWGATSLVGQLQESLNTLWGVKFNQEGLDWQSKLWRKTRALLVVGGGGLLLLLTQVASSVLGLIHKYQPSWLGGFDGVWAIVPHVLTFALTVGLFAMLFRVLPDAEIHWKDVLYGAIGTAVLFTVGRVLLTLYFEKAAPASSYGAAGSLVVLLLFIYWSSQILFFGAMFTRIHACANGKKIRPMEGAELTEVPTQGSQGGAPATEKEQKQTQRAPGRLATT